MTSDSSSVVFALAALCSGPIFFITTVVLWRRLIERGRMVTEQDEVLKEVLRERKVQTVAREEHIRMLAEHIERLETEREEVLREKKEQIADLEARIHALAANIERDEWLKSIVKNTYRNEVEVEIKFVYSLMRFLGYTNNELQIRVPVEVQVGRQPIRAEADWVVFDSGTGKQVIVIEAKGPGEALDETVRDQGRSYAFALKVPIYALTNGRRLQVYQRGVVEDECIVDCGMDKLVDAWDQVEHAMGKRKA